MLAPTPCHDPKARALPSVVDFSEKVNDTVDLSKTN
jgi:hypothetical protein